VAPADLLVQGTEESCTSRSSAWRFFSSSCASSTATSGRRAPDAVTRRARRPARRAPARDDPASRPSGCGRRPASAPAVSSRCLTSWRFCASTPVIPRDRPPLPPEVVQGPPQLREGPSSLRARAHRAGQAVCQRVPPRTSHCHTACTPPCPIIAIIRLRPGRPFPWPTALHNRGLCKLGRAHRAHEDGADFNALVLRRRQRLRPSNPHRGIGPPAGQSCLHRFAARQAGPLPALLTGTTPTASGTRSRAHVFGAARGPPSDGVPCSSASAVSYRDVRDPRRWATVSSCRILLVSAPRPTRRKALGGVIFLRAFHG
jgi:hypothetical protein